MTFTLGDILALFGVAAVVVFGAWSIAHSFRNHLDMRFNHIDTRFDTAETENRKAHDTLKDALNAVVQDVAYIRGRQAERDQGAGQ